MVDYHSEDADSLISKDMTLTRDVWGMLYTKQCNEPLSVEVRKLWLEIIEPSSTSENLADLTKALQDYLEARKNVYKHEVHLVEISRTTKYQV